MSRAGFAFDTNRCTGCNACQIACIIENQLDFSTLWRKVIIYNESLYPDLPVFYLSMACNHCGDPPCINSCPALAYYRDERFETVQIDPPKCIGCQYCSWVCPYDAPTYQPDRGVMAKCTFCLTRLRDNLKPACVSNCPTDALKLCDMEATHIQPKVPGFTVVNIDPALKIEALAANRKIPEAEKLPFAPSIMERWNGTTRTSGQKAGLKSEWSLLLFTLLVPWLVAHYAHSLSLVGSHFTPVILAAGIAGMIISSLHLGRKPRAYRAILNWKKSWLSREIICYSLFLLLMSLSELILPGNLLFISGTLLAGIFSLIAIDMVYLQLPRLKNIRFHSAQVTLTALLYWSILSENIFLLTAMLLIKGAIFIRQSVSEHSLFSFFSMVRISAGFVLPGLLWLSGFSLHSYLTWSMILGAEVIDRTFFYKNLAIITPERQMNADFQEDLAGLGGVSSSRTE